MAKKKLNFDGIVFSTNPEFKKDSDEKEMINTLPAAQQVLRVRLDTKHRAGKAVTLVTGYSGRDEDLEALGKQIKNFCGTGGSVKEGGIIVQGDQRDKVLQWLLKNGYKLSKKV